MITINQTGAGVQRLLRPHVPGPGQLQPAPVSPLTVETILLREGLMGVGDRVASVIMLTLQRCPAPMLTQLV